MRNSTLLLLFITWLLPRAVTAQEFNPSEAARLKERYNTILHSDDKKRVKKLEAMLDSIQRSAPQYIKTCDKCDGTYYYMVSAQCKRCKGAGTVKHNVCTGTGKIPCPQCEGKKIYNDPVCLGTGKEACRKCNGKGNIEADCVNCLGTGQATCYMCNGVINKSCIRCRGTGKDQSFNTQSSSSAVNCSACGGTGKEYCLTCNNSRKIRCQNCNSTGKVYTPCNACNRTGFLGPCPTPNCKSGKLDCFKCDPSGNITCPKCNNGYVKCTGFGGSCGDGTTTYRMECGFCNGFGREIKLEP